MLDREVLVDRRELLASIAAATAGGVALGSALRPSPASAVTLAARPVRVVVASKDAPANVKANADYVCTGTNDQTVINNAITEAATGPIGGSSEGALNSVQCSGGRFNLSGSVLLRSGVDLSGGGPFATIFKAVNLTAVSGAGTRVAMVKLLDTNTHGCGIHDLALEGNYVAGGTCDGLVYTSTTSGSPTGYPPTSPDPDCYAYNMFVNGFRSVGVGGLGRNGVYAEVDMRSTLFHTMWIREVSGDGLVLTGSPDSNVDRIIVGGVDGTGINIAGGNNKVVNSKAFYCDVAGMRLVGNRGSFAGLEAQDCVVGFDLAGSPMTLSAITADTCRDDGIKVSAKRTILSGFQIFWRSGGRYNSQVRGLTISAGLSRCQITGVINPLNITTPRQGTMGAPAFVRIDDGGATLYSVG